MNSKQRRKALRRCARVIEAHGRKQCEALGMDPDGWGGETLNYNAVYHELMLMYRLLRVRRRQI